MRSAVCGGGGGDGAAVCCCCSCSCCCSCCLCFCCCCLCCCYFCCCGAARRLHTLSYPTLRFFFVIELLILLRIYRENEDSLGQLRVALRQLGAAGGLTGEGTEMNSRLIGQLEEVCVCDVTSANLCGVTSAGSKCVRLRSADWSAVVVLVVGCCCFVFCRSLFCRNDAITTRIIISFRKSYDCRLEFQWFVVGGFRSGGSAPLTIFPRPRPLRHGCNWPEDNPRFRREDGCAFSKPEHDETTRATEDNSPPPPLQNTTLKKGVGLTGRERRDDQAARG